SRYAECLPEAFDNRDCPFLRARVRDVRFPPQGEAIRDNKNKPVLGNPDLALISIEWYELPEALSYAKIGDEIFSELTDRVTIVGYGVSNAVDSNIGAGDRKSTR